MIVFHDVMQRVRLVLAEQNQLPKIKDRDVALALELDPQYFAVIKRRSKIPYEALAHFCRKHRISLNWILFAQDPPHLT
ncbi:prophage MuSo1, transcriptional regulator, Cro/CI family [hydrothermal vent metagenome]|uniref:Prophage MuSo1, transcriptional regulator, Cro/CI family n=1 Tax=hydrothermal vent metagenome TaxID=652676 RepID=A0A1W1E7Z3_9ZZZZ